MTNRVESLGKALRIPRQSLADILHVTREQLYLCLQQPDEAETLERLTMVELAVSSIKTATPYVVGKSATIVTLNDETLIECLQKETISTREVQALAREIHNHIEASRQGKIDPEAQVEQDNLSDWT